MKTFHFPASGPATGSFNGLHPKSKFPAVIDFMKVAISTITLLWAAAGLGFSAPAPVTSAKPPNIVIILADDLGVECLSTYGGTSHKTPNLDKLAAQGMRFTRCFSNPFCSPSRASLLTGRYPFKNGLKTVLYKTEQENVYLQPDQPSFARQLKEAGYATAIAGKWHLSLEHKHDTINELGFEQYNVWRIFDDQGRKTTKYWTPYILRNGKVIAEQIKDRYGPDVDLDFYLDFIKTNVTKSKPFLAYYATCLPHSPWESTPDSADQSYRATDIGNMGDPKYFPDMLAYLDKHVGRILQTLEELGIADNTIVIFLADNGTAPELVNRWGDGKQIRGGKGTMTDRGTHVPLLVRWPGHIKTGVTCDDLVDFSDLFPTLCELTATPLPETKLHGRSFAPQLLGKPGHPREWVHIQNANARQVRNSDYMLNNKQELRRVVELWEDPAPPNENKKPEAEAAARKSLQAAFDQLGK